MDFIYLLLGWLGSILAAALLDVLSRAIQCLSDEDTNSEGY
jgi:hypothetical protein